MKYRVDSADLTSVADAIRAKGGTSASLPFPDGFVSAVQNIPTGGGSTLVTGTFEANQSEKGAAKSITIPYTGSGHPLVGIIYPSGGADTGDIASYANTNTPFIYSFVKSDFSLTPTYGSSSSATENLAIISTVYKNSSSDPTAIAADRGIGVMFNSDSARATLKNCVRFTDRTTLTVYIGDNSTGFPYDIEFAYQIFYSS